MTDTRPLTDLLGESRARILGHLQQAPSTAGELAELLSISAAAVRRHLTALAADQLIAGRTVRDGTRGRPHEEYSLTARGRRLFADRSAEFADDLLQHVEATFGRTAVLEYLRTRADRQAERYAEDLADIGDPEQRSEALAAALSEDGFAARVERQPLGDGGTRTLTLVQSHCAIEGIAADHPEVCAHEAALFKRLLGTKVSRRSTIASGADACVCHIELPHGTDSPGPPSREPPETAGSSATTSPQSSPTHDHPMHDDQTMQAESPTATRSS